jgi:hypothetical protein
MAFVRTYVATMIVTTKKNKPHWGARKIRELLVKKLDGDVRVPAKSTVHAILDRHGLVTRARRRPRHRAEGTALSQALLPNDLWAPISRASSSSAIVDTVTR